jgi:hypothetical protein
MTFFIYPPFFELKKCAFYCCDRGDLTGVAHKTFQYWQNECLADVHAFYLNAPEISAGRDTAESMPLHAKIIFAAILIVCDFPRIYVAFTRMKFIGTY